MGDRKRKSSRPGGPPLLRSPPRSDFPAIDGRPQVGGYVPYQDALYYRPDNSSSSRSSDDRKKRYDVKRYKVQERHWRRRPDGKTDYWEDRGYIPDTPLRLSRNNMKKQEKKQEEKDEEWEDSDDEKAVPPAKPDDEKKKQKSKTDKKDDDEEYSNDEDDSNDDSKVREAKKKQRLARKDKEQRQSKNRGIPGRRPDPKVPPKDDPRRPPEKYTALKAAKAAAWAGGVEVARCRLEPGPWTGQKGKRVALAAAVGVAIGALRNGKLLNSGKMPYAEAAMTGFYAIDFLKRVARHTDHGKDAMKEQEEWYKDEEYVADREKRGAEFQARRTGW